VSANPPYNYALGATDQAGAPPFDLSKVVMRVFPVRANYHSLQLFCDRFINIAPEYSHFEPSAPFVLFCVINYGHMGNVASNLGYTSQHEVLFAVPLNWHRKQEGRWTLQPRASISPFIWVDEPASAWTGRNVFGWPKSLAWLTPGLNEWTKDPTAPRTLFTLSALMYPRLFAGQRQEPSILLEVEQDQPSSVTQFPPNPMNPLNPWIGWPRGVLESLRLGADLFETAARLPTFGYPPWGKGANILEMMVSSFGDYNPVGSLPASNTINLKQFRHPTHPQSISYQAIVNSKMSPKSFRRGGLLGEGGLFRGDTSGGYRVRVFRRPAWPIIESLGLEVADEVVEEGQSVASLKPVFPFWVDVDFEYGAGEVICWRTRGSHWTPPPDGTPIAPPPDQQDSRPTASAPVAADGPDSQDDSEAPIVAPAVVMAAKERKAQQEFINEFVCDRCGTAHLYNTAEGSAIEQVYGPFHFPNATVRVLPLLADWNKLMEFTDAYLNWPSGGPGTRLDKDGNLLTWPSDQTDGRQSMPNTERTPSGNLFIPWGRYVYLTIMSYENITSELNVGFWARLRATFSFPVKWYQWTDEPVNERRPGGPTSLCDCTYDDVAPVQKIEPHWGLKSFGVVSPFMYVDTTAAATVGREMNGWPVAEADIQCPPTEWLLENGPIRSANDLMTLSTDVMPALNANQKTVRAKLVEVTTRDPAAANNDEEWVQIAATWGERQAIEAARKARKGQSVGGGWPPRRRQTWLKSTGMEVLFRGQPLNHIALKQFRDAKDPFDACLQTINVYPESVERIHDMRSIDDAVYVAIHKYPTQPIVDRLGLDVKWTDTSGGQPVQYLQAIRPFWMRADLKADLGRDVKWRAGSEEWQDGDSLPLYFDEGEKYATPALAAELADEDPKAVQNFGTRRFFARAIRRSQQKFSGGWSHHRRGHWDLLRHSDVDFSPQIAIESMLTHRWVNLDPHLPELKQAVRWDTLIPSESIPNPEARARFLRKYGLRAGGDPGGTVEPFNVVSEYDEAAPYWYVRPDDLPRESAAAEQVDVDGGEARGEASKDES